MLSAVSVLVADHCPAWWLQPNHPKVPTTRSACRKAGPASCVDGTSRQGFPGSGTTSACQEAKRDLLAPCTATVPRPHPAILPHVHPSNALGHMGRCPRPAIQPLTPPLDYDLTLAPPSPWKSPPSPRPCRAQLLVHNSPSGGAQPGVHGGRPTDCCGSRILPEWQCEGRSHFLLFFVGSPGL